MQRRRANGWLLLALFGCLIFIPQGCCFAHVGHGRGYERRTETRRRVILCVGSHRDRNDNNNNLEEEEDEWLQPKSPLDLRSFQYNNVAEGDYSDLQPPVFNLRKESLLFDENATTRRDNNVQRLWNFCVTHLPYVFHGCSVSSSSSSSSKKNNNNSDSRSHIIKMDPMAALYNMIFVRFPVIAAGWLYAYQWIIRQENPLIVDLGIVGDGTLEVPPLLVGLILWIILR